MAASIERRAVSGGVAASISFGVNTALSLLQVPLLLHFWGRETYGTWLSIFALIAVITSMDIGFQNYVGNEVVRQYLSDVAALPKLLASAIRAAVFVGACELLVMFVILGAGHFSLLDAMSLPQPSPDAVGAVLIYLVSWTFLGSIPVIVTRVFLPRGEFVRMSFWEVGTKISQFLGLCVALVLHLSLTASMALWCAAGAPIVIAMLYDLRKRMPEVSPWWQGGSLRVGLRMFAKSTLLTLTSFVDQLGNNGLILLVGRAVGVGRVPAFTTVRTVANTAMAGTSIFFGPLRADVVRFHVNREMGKINEVLAGVWLLTGTLLQVGFLLSPLFVEALYGVWTRGKLPFDEWLFILLATAVCLRNVGSTLVGFLFSVNALRSQVVLTVARSAIVIVGAMVLLPWLGLPGAAVAIVLSEAIASIGVAGVLTDRLMRAPGRPGLNYSYLWHALGGVAVVFAALVFFKLVPGSKWVGVPVALGVVAASAVYQFRRLDETTQERILRQVKSILTNLGARFGFVRAASAG